MTAPTPAAVAKECAEQLTIGLMEVFPRKWLPCELDAPLYVDVIARVLEPILARHLARAEQAVAKAEAFDALEALARDYIVVNVAAAVPDADDHEWIVYAAGGGLLPRLHCEGPTLAAALLAGREAGA